MPLVIHNPFALWLSRNIVSTVNLGCKLDLKGIALRARNAEYNPKVGCYVEDVRCYVEDVRCNSCYWIHVYLFKCSVLQQSS